MSAVAAPWLDTRMRILALVLLAACGDNSIPSGIRPLVPDPDVETGCVPGPVTGTRAKVVGCGDELIAGRLASGRVGDFVLENANLRVIVRGPGEGYLMHGTSGGGIVDAASISPAGLPAEDLVKEIFVSVDLNAAAFDELVITEAGNDGPAELVVRGPATGIDIVQAALDREIANVIVEHHYRLAEGAHELELVTKVFPGPDGDAGSHDLFDAMFMGGRAPGFVPGNGFDSGAGGGEIIATSGTTSSYALVYETATPQLIDLAGIRLVGGPPTDDEGTTRFLVIGDGSVSSVTERAWQLRGTPVQEISGTTSPNVDVVIEQGSKPITVARSDAQGAFRTSVPIGSHEAHAEAFGVKGTTISVGVGTNVPGIAFGQLAISVRDDDGHEIPARVMITPHGGEDRIEWIDSTGEGSFRVPAGVYRVSVSRGMEYEVFEAAVVTIADGITVQQAVMLEHVVDTAGWISVDTHLHSELSPDSTFPIDDRLRAVAAEGVEVAVSTDHDIVVDYTGVINELGLSGWMTSIVGSEVSSLAFGHLNGFPLAVDPDRTGGGGVRWKGKPPGVVFDEIRGSDPTRVVQANHPHDGGTSLFDALQLDVETLMAGRDPTTLGFPEDTDLNDLSFDAIEVANASSAGDFPLVFQEWLVMVSKGHPACATGSSDSHGATRFAGSARTFVFVGQGSDDPVVVDEASIAAAIKARHVVVGTGAFVTAGVVKDGVESIPGDTTSIAGLAEVTLHVRVQAPSWQPIGTVRIFQGRTEVKTIAIDPDDAGAVRFDSNVVLPLPATDTFYVVRVDMAGRGDPVLGDSMPSFTNPVFVTK